MLDKIIDIFGDNGTYVSLNPEFMENLITNARMHFQDYKELAYFINCSCGHLFRYKRNPNVAASIDKISKLLELTKTTLNKKDIKYIQRSKSGYPMPSYVAFSEKPWKIIDDWSHYILGSIAADGNVHKGVIGFKISPNDVEFSAMHVYGLLNLAERIHQRYVNIYIGIDRGERLGKPTTSVALASITLTSFFEKILGLRLDTNYNVPHWVYNNKSFFSWLGGVTDGDGNIWKSGRDKPYWFWRVFNGGIEPLIEIKKNLSVFVKTEARARFEGKGKYVFAIQKLEFIKEIFPKILPYTIIENKRENIIRALDDLENKGYRIEIPDKQRNTRNPIMDNVVDFLKERGLLTKLQNWEKLECYGKVL